jgi:ABC-type tungstate transport system substrate-binding protein
MGCFGPLYSPTAMVIAQTVIVTPIIAALARQTIEDLRSEYDEQLHALGVQPCAQSRFCSGTAASACSSPAPWASGEPLPKSEPSS